MRTIPAETTARRAAFAALALSIALYGCGGDGGPSTGPITDDDAATTLPGDDGGTTLPGDDAGTQAGEDAGTQAGEDAGTQAGEDAGGGCPLGYEGGDCSLCAAGYATTYADLSACVPTCEVTTGPNGFTCGASSECQFSIADGARSCVCLDGYEGDACDTCSAGWHVAGSTCQLDPPPGLSLVLWLDGDEPSTIDVDDTMKVVAWRDRRGLGDVAAVATSIVERPSHLPTGRNSRGVVDFDGVDDQLVVNGFSMLGSQDFEVIVAAMPSGAVPNGLFGAVSGTSNWAFMLERYTSTDFRAIYRKTPSTSGGETITLARTVPSGPLYVSASHMTSTSVDTLAMWGSNGSAGDALAVRDVTTSSPMASPINLRIGRTQNGLMDGPIYEVLVYSRRLSVAEREGVFLYLREKWHLP